MQSGAARRHTSPSQARSRKVLHSPLSVSGSDTRPMAVHVAHSFLHPLEEA